MKSLTKLLISLSLLIVFIVLPSVSYACPACASASSLEETAGLKAAYSLLLVMPLAIVGGVAFGIVYIGRKQNLSVTEQEDNEINNNPEGNPR